MYKPILQVYCNNHFDLNQIMHVFCNKMALVRAIQYCPDIIVADRMVNISNEPVVIFQSGRDKNGAAIALFTARIHQPSLTSHQLVLKALVYQLDAALERYRAILWLTAGYKKKQLPLPVLTLRPYTTRVNNRYYYFQV